MSSCGTGFFSRITTAAVLLITAGVLVLSACQPTGQAPAVLPAASATPQAATPQREPTARQMTATPLPQFRVDPQALQGVEVRFWHPWSGESAVRTTDLVEEFNRENIWGIRVSISAPGGEAVLREQAGAALESDRRPAVVAAPLDALTQWSRQGAWIVDLNPYTADPEWGLSERETSDFLPLFWQQDVVDGTRLGIPAQRDARLLFYNQSWAKELGFDRPPSNTDDFRRQSCAAMRSLLADPIKTNDGMGGWIIDRSADTLLSWMAAFGAGVPAAAEQTYRFNSPEAAAAFTYLRELFDSSCAWISRNPQPYDYFAGRQALFFSGSLKDLQLQDRAQKRLESTDQWTVLPFPAQQGGEGVLLSGGPSYAVVRSTPAEQLASWLFIRWMILPRHQARLVEAGPSLPLAESVRTELAGFARRNPHWAQVNELIAGMQPGPSQADWWLSGSVLEDAGWQLLQPTPLPPAAILQQLDDTLPEVLKNQP